MQHYMQEEASDFWRRKAEMLEREVNHLKLQIEKLVNANIINKSTS